MGPKVETRAAPGIRPDSQNARILHALDGGAWVSASEIARRAGPSSLSSRVSELRKKGYPIEHRMVPGKVGALRHQYRLRGGPPLPEIDLSAFASKVSLPREGTPRDMDHRFRIYRMVYDKITLVATAPDRERMGVAIFDLGEDDVFAHSCVGVLDTYGTDAIQGTWLINPWDTTPEAKDLEFTPNWASPPGETMAEMLEMRDWTQARLARETRFTPKHVNRVVNGKAAIGVDFAIALERIDFGSARFWLHREADYRLALKTLANREKQNE